RFQVADFHCRRHGPIYPVQQSQPRKKPVPFENYHYWPKSAPFISQSCADWRSVKRCTWAEVGAKSWGPRDEVEIQDSSRRSHYVTLIFDARDRGGVGHGGVLCRHRRWTAGVGSGPGGRSESDVIAAGGDFGRRAETRLRDSSGCARGEDPKPAQVPETRH